MSPVSDKECFIRAYTDTYLKEEVWSEHLVRKLKPFQYFLEVAAQSNGTTVNFAKMAREIGSSDNSIAEYFSILSDTLVGFMLPTFNHSFRKRLIQKPKFYFFDCGVVQALKKTLSVDLQPGTYDYGNAFEHFIITEILKCVSYTPKKYCKGLSSTR